MLVGQKSRHARLIVLVHEPAPAAFVQPTLEPRREFGQRIHVHQVLAFVNEQDVVQLCWRALEGLE